MTAALLRRPRRAARLGWLSGVLTAALIATFGVALATPSGASLPATSASTFVPADATRGKVTLRLDDAEAPAELSDARLAARAVPGAVSSTAYVTLPASLRARTQDAWYREAVVPVDGSVPARYRWRAVDDRGIWLVLQDWGSLGMTFDGLLELPADVAPGRTWTSSGTARAQPDAGDLRVERTSTASTPDDLARAREGCLSVASRTSITGARSSAEAETSLWCPGKGVVAQTGALGDHAYALTSGGAATPVTDADLAEAGWDPSGLATWKLRARTVLAGDETFGLVDAASTPLLDTPRSPVVTASGTVVLPSYEGGDLVGLSASGSHLWAHWWARPGGQVTALGTVGDLVVAPTTAHRVSAYRAGRTLAWNTPLDDVAVAPPLPAGDVILLATVSGSLTALDARTGAARWTTAVGGGVHAPLAAGDGVVVTADTGGNVTAWDVSTGTQRWQVGDVVSPFATTLVVADGQVVVAAGGTLTAYAVADGHRSWAREAGLGLGATARVGDELWIGVDDGLEAWSVADGTSRWNLAGSQPLTTDASRCTAPADAGLGLVRQGGSLVAVAGDGAVVGTWPLPVGQDDVVTATCRGAGVDLTAYAPDGSHPLLVLRLGPT